MVMNSTSLFIKESQLLILKMHVYLYHMNPFVLILINSCNTSIDVLNKYIDDFNSLFIYF